MTVWMGRGAFAAIGALLVAAGGVRGDGLVNLEFSPDSPAVGVNDVISIDLIARTGGDKELPLSGLTIVLDWDPDYLQLVGLINRPTSGLNSSFPFPGLGDLDFLNQSFLDGDAWYQAIAQIPPPPVPVAVATPDGLLVTTFQFRALAMTSATEITIPAMRGSFSQSAVISGVIPGLDLLGATGAADVQIVPEPATLLLMAVGVMAVGLRRGRAVGAPA